ncbi:uncharacterized protein LY89DRAFT_676308 [Mollisia scopiformis]|uniref:Uncharacterized protein n=1 Tax=Mollisia scopiformis TaxID=149040 RepID=A0A132BB90_MOLSC|nr:uncharacterized protein LY89DRAFT_676308 [Mollisia scopiformis]KUJ08927.1 hypothetical protein LY89DRAFT_676308 [Mollisia scopiformis]
MESRWSRWSVWKGWKLEARGSRQVTACPPRAELNVSGVVPLRNNGMGPVFLGASGFRGGFCSGLADSGDRPLSTGGGGESWSQIRRMRTYCTGNLGEVGLWTVDCGLWIVDCGLWRLGSWNAEVRRNLEKVEMAVGTVWGSGSGSGRAPSLPGTSCMGSATLRLYRPSLASASLAKPSQAELNVDRLYLTPPTKPHFAFWRLSAPLGTRLRSLADVDAADDPDPRLPESRVTWQLTFEEHIARYRDQQLIIKEDGSAQGQKFALFKIIAMSQVAFLPDSSNT